MKNVTKSTVYIVALAIFVDLFSPEKKTSLMNMFLRPKQIKTTKNVIVSEKKLSILKNSVSSFHFSQIENDIKPPLESMTEYLLSLSIPSD